MARAYNSPGVTVSESVNPSLAPVLANPQIVALVAPAKGSRGASERLILSGTTAVTLAHTGISTASVVVTASDTGATVNPGAYVVVQGTDPNTGITGDEPYTIARRTQPTAAPTAAASGTGTLVGTYDYIYTYINAGGETGASPVSNAVTPATAGNNLTGITVGPAGTSARNVYRRKTSVGGDNIYHLVATISDNVTTTLTNETTTDLIAQGNGTTTFGTAQPSTGIADGATVIVSYTYTDNHYFEPTLLDDYDDIVDKYGAPFDANGNINSQLAFAARLIFLNGASEVICVAAATSTQSDIDAGLAQLELRDDANIIVTTGGTQANASSVASHVNKMNGQGEYRIGVAGIDGSSTSVPAATLRTNAIALNNEAVRLISPASWNISNPVTNRVLNLGGQYVAAAIAGMYAGRDVQVPLTRKSVAGIDGLNDNRTASELALDSSSGLLVVENRGGILRVRHDLTTAVGSVNTREASVVRAKYEMASRLRRSLDTGVIGVVVPQDRAPLLVQGSVAGVLEQLLSEGAINGYSDIKARVLADPTTIEVRFQYIPAYPINNISVVFTINTTTGTTDFTLTGT